MDQQITSTTREKMQKALEVLKTDLATIRTGRAMPSLVENVAVPVYGGSARLKILELATITAPDTQTLLLTPFDQSVIHEIKKGLEEANTGLTPVVDGQVIRIAIPPLSQERREQLIALMRQKLENARITIRQMRHEALNDIKKAEFPEDEASRIEKEIQKLTDDNTAEIEAIGKRKEEELMQI